MIFSLEVMDFMVIIKSLFRPLQDPISTCSGFFLFPKKKLSELQSQQEKCVLQRGGGKNISCL